MTDQRWLLLSELTEALDDFDVVNKSSIAGSQVEALMDVANLLWEAEHGAPALEDDPVALILGLVPKPGVALDRNALNRLRKNAGLTVSQLADRLSARGWDVTASQIFRWQTQGAFDLSPALLGAIADELGVATERILLSSTEESRPKWLTDVAGSSAFNQLVQRWARLHGLTTQLASEALESRMLAAVHRGGRPQADQLLQSLEALVSAKEKGNGEAVP